jgi:predicted HAD superfamily Cof-like phosphohydrolase
MLPSVLLVKQFHRVFKHPVKELPDLSDDKTNKLRVNLIAEELKELAEALGLKLEINMTEDPTVKKDHVKTLDALTDLQIVLDGGFIALGYYQMKSAAVSEVHRSNMSKADENGKPILRADGKILKGPNYQPPNLEGVILNHMKALRYAQ